MNHEEEIYESLKGELTNSDLFDLEDYCEDFINSLESEDSLEEEAA